MTSLLFFKRSRGGTAYWMEGAYFAIAICLSRMVSFGMALSTSMRFSLLLRMSPPGMLTDMSSDASSPVNYTQLKGDRIRGRGRIGRENVVKTTTSYACTRGYMDRIFTLSTPSSCICALHIDVYSITIRNNLTLHYTYYIHTSRNCCRSIAMC